MNTLKNTILIVSFLLFLVASLNAEVITIFDSNSVISDGDSYDTVVVKGDCTVVEMTGGTVNKLITMNASTFNMHGGIITTDAFFYDSSVVNLYGGTTQRFIAWSLSSVNISGNANIIWRSKSRDSTVIRMNSQNASVDGLWLFDFSTLYLSDGSIQSLDVTGSNEVRITGGNIDYLRIYDSTGSINSLVIISGGIVNRIKIIAAHGYPSPMILMLSGGNIGQIEHEAGENDGGGNNINIIGYDLNVVPYGGLFGYGQVTGYWNNEVYFEIDLASHNSYPRINLFDGVIPPHCSDKPESDLSGDCKVNFTDFSKMADEWLDCGLEPNEACWQ